MKYFTSELWDLINSENEEVRQQAELKWNENSQQYNNYFNCTIKKRLNKKGMALVQVEAYLNRRKIYFYS